MIGLLKTSNPNADFLGATEKYLERVITEIEDLQIYPRLGNNYRDVVLLSLFDKVMTSSRAVLSLAREGFSEDAFALSRTTLETFISLKYIENKDSEQRAKRFIDYFAKDRQNLANLIAKHHPHISEGFSGDHAMLMELAKQFKSPHKWFEDGVSLKEAAYEKSTWAVNDKGEPEQWEYSYDVVYKFTSHEVHATSVALWSRINKFFERTNFPAAFKFSSNGQESNADTALVNVCIYTQASIYHLFHAFEIAMPQRLLDQFHSWQQTVGIVPASESDDN
jgi:Family of unknown function (DUF5677)